MRVIGLLLCLFLAVQLQRILYEKRWKRGLKADVFFCRKAITEGESVQVGITVENDKWLPLPALSVVFSLPQEFTEVQTKQKNLMNTFHRNELFTLYSHQRVRRTLTFSCRQRGVYTVRELMLVSRSLLMDREDTALLPIEKRLFVYPRCVNMHTFLHTFQNTIGEILAQNFLNEDVFLVRSLREYRSYDSQRSINWKASAKQGKLMVNQYEYTDSRKVAIFLDLTQGALKQEQQIAEESIRLAKTWCVNLKKFGILCDLYTNGKETVDGDYLSVEGSKQQQNYVYAVNEALTKIAVCPDGSFAEALSEQIAACARDCFLLLISPDYREPFQRALVRLKRRTDRFLWIVPKTSAAVYKILPQLAGNYVGWNVYWRREER